MVVFVQIAFLSLTVYYFVKKLPLYIKKDVLNLIKGFTVWGAFL